MASSLEKKKMSVLILLDLSAAFDTIDHSILLNRLADRFHVRRTAFSWFKSYLTNRHQVIKTGGAYSKEAPLSFGVPQGSILGGPLLFSLYTAPVGDLALRHGICVHMYADDTQLYVMLENRENAISRIEQCIAQIKDWMTAYFLRLNSDKTEVLLIGSPFKFRKLSQIVNEKCKYACYNIRCISQTFFFKQPLRHW